MKTCSRCGQAKPLDDFKTDTRKPDGKASSCKACVAVPKVGEAPRAHLTQLGPEHERLTDHPFAGLFPLLSDTELRDLAEDIAVNGQRDPVIIHQGKILDGRNRYRACLRRELAVTCETFSGTDDEALDYVISKNIFRRHLDASQRAHAMASYEQHRWGGPRSTTGQDANLHLDDTPISPPATRAELAERGHVSARLIASAAVVRDHGTSDLNEAVRDGAIVASAAEEIARRPADEQTAILATLPRDDTGKLTPAAKKALAPVIKEIRAEKQIEKKARRDQRETDLGAKLLALPDKKFGVAIEDFEWDHEPWSRETGMDRHPSNHYPTSADAHTPEEIVARTAERFACLADDCVLYMWTTIPHAAIAQKVLELRGFKYVTQRVWGKLRKGDGRGPGYWVTGEHEILLFAVRGNVVPPATAHFRSFFIAPVGEHSEKPVQQYEHAEFHFPNLPKIELNARRGRVGWMPWGYDAPVGQADLDSRDGTEDAA